MESPRLLRLPDGRTLAYDEVGDPTGTPVVYLHGTPDSRFARHPDDAIAGDEGVRLLAVDRPGAGDSHLDPKSSLTSLGADLAHLLDALSIARVTLIGWSAGGLFALGAAAVLRDRVRSVGLVGTLPPAEAYDDRELIRSLGPARRHFVELANDLDTVELAAEVAALLVPSPLTPELALEHVLETAGPRGRAELASVPGAAEQLARAVLGAVQQGTAGLERDLALQLERGLDLGLVAAPVRAFHGADDATSPPSVGAWLASHLPDAVLDLVPDAGHHVLFPRWRGILRAVLRDGRYR
ncbi:MAG: alpha/beta fold hydrolase [Microthrixaceae bacterium]